MTRILHIAAAMLAASALLPSTASPCPMQADDEAWLRAALSNWRYVARTKLRLASTAPPAMVIFDKGCVFRLARHARPGRWRGSTHDGQIKLPDGTEIPAQVTSFAKPAEGGAFLVMSLPSVWREKVRSELGLERLMHAVLLHEATHTAHTEFVSRELDDLTRRYGLPDDISDDSLQEEFSSNPAYAADYAKERDLFYAAAAAASDAEAVRLAREGLAALRARRAKWFSGAAEKWAALDDVFLAMEGLGQWAAYAWLIDPKGAGVDSSFALKEMRRGGKRWTQDEGLAIFLVIDRLVPNWQSRMLGKQPPTLEAALSLAGRER